MIETSSLGSLLNLSALPTSSTLTTLLIAFVFNFKILNYLKVSFDIAFYPGALCRTHSCYNMEYNLAHNKYNANNEKQKSANHLESIKIASILVDIGKIPNLNLKSYTWCIRNPLQQLRLDFWLSKDTFGIS